MTSDSRRDKRNLVRALVLGCAALLVVGGSAVAAALIGSVWWVFSPGTQIDTRLLVGPDTTFVAHIDGIDEDPRLRRWLQASAAHLFMAVDRQRVETGPDNEWIRHLQEFNAQRNAASADYFVPDAATVVLDERDGQQMAALAINFSHYVRPIRAGLRMVLEPAMQEDGRVVHRGDHTVFVFGDDVAMAFAHSTLVWAEGVDHVFRILDRVDAALEEPLPLRDELDGHCLEWTAVTVGRDASVLAGMLPKDRWELVAPALLEFGDFWGAARMSGDDEVSVRLTLTAHGDATRREQKQTTGALCEAFESVGASAGLRADCTRNADGHAVELRVEYSNVAKATRIAIDRMVQDLD